MRRYRRLTMVVVTLIALLVLPAQGASARATFTECEAELELVWWEEGAVTFHGPNMHVRGRRILFEQASDNPLCTGSIHVVANYNVRADGEGPKWGTFVWEASDGGFEGSYTGWSENHTLSSNVRAVGRGYGELRGRQLREYIDFHPSVLHGMATLTILDPHGE